MAVKEFKNKLLLVLLIFTILHYIKKYLTLYSAAKIFTIENNDLINKDLLNKNIENSIDEFLSEEFKNLEDEKIMKKISIYKTQHSRPSVTEYVVNAIQNGLKANKIKPGRPKQEFDTSFHAVNRFFEKYINKLQSLVENNFWIKRSDTFRFTIFSYLKKLPIKLREMSCSVSDPKSNRFEIYLDAFLSPFVNCFLKYFDFSGNTKDKLEHFLYFISIWFPTSKCCQVLDVFLKEGTIDKETIQNIKINLKQRKGKSKKDILSFLNLNPCFKRYSANLLIKLDNSKFNEHANTMIKDFIQI